MLDSPSSPVPVTVPNLGNSTAPLTVNHWFVEPGEAVLAGDALLEVLFPGITCDIVAPVSGRLDRIAKDVDAVVHTGEILGWIVPEAVASEFDDAHSSH